MTGETWVLLGFGLILFWTVVELVALWLGHAGVVRRFRAWRSHKT